MTTYLSRLVLDLEQQVASAGWDQAPQLFALVETTDLLRREPQLADQLGIPSASRALSRPSTRATCPPTAAWTRCWPASPGPPRSWVPRSPWSG